MKQELDRDCQPLPARLVTEQAAELQPEHLTTEQAGKRERDRPATEQAEEHQGDVPLPAEVVQPEPVNIQDESANPSDDPEQDLEPPQPTR
jgi:hypothetical protein